MTIRSEIELLTKESKGKSLEAKVVVEKARTDKRLPALNKHLWGLSEADLAMEARLARAHRLIIRLNIVTVQGVSTRMLIHTNGTRGYQPTETVAQTPNLAIAKLLQLRGDIRRARDRLHNFSMILDPDVAASIDAALGTAERLTERPNYEVSGAVA
jgi:hypothetical protein